MWAVLLVALGTCQAQRGPGDGLPAEIRKQIGKTRELAPCVVASLPEPVRQALAQAAHQRELAMADPGQKWSSSDLVQAGLPRQQLVSAAHSERVWVVDYRKGGLGVSHRVAVIDLEGGSGRVLWSGRCSRGRDGKGKWRCTELER